MPNDTLSLGQLVRSNTGRDKGHIYLLVGFVTPSMVLLADGRNRKVSEPKKKNVRHISVLKSIDNGVAAKIAGRLKITDEEIRQIINTCVCTGEK